MHEILLKIKVPSRTSKMVIFSGVGIALILLNISFFADFKDSQANYFLFIGLAIGILSTIATNFIKLDEVGKISILNDFLIVSSKKQSKKVSYADIKSMTVKIQGAEGEFSRNINPTKKSDFLLPIELGHRNLIIIKSKSELQTESQFFIENKQACLRLLRYLKDLADKNNFDLKISN